MTLSWVVWTFFGSYMSVTNWSIPRGNKNNNSSLSLLAVQQPLTSNSDVKNILNAFPCIHSTVTHYGGHKKKIESKIFKDRRCILNSKHNCLRLTSSSIFCLWVCWINDGELFSVKHIYWPHWILLILLILIDVIPSLSFTVSCFHLLFYLYSVST